MQQLVLVGVGTENSPCGLEADRPSVSPKAGIHDLDPTTA